MTRPVRGSKDNASMRHPGVLADSEALGTYIPYLLNRLTNRWNIDQNRDLSEFGINGTILRALSVLYIFKTLTVNEIANYALVEQSNASRSVDAMVAAGLVERQVGETDLRRREIALTDKGERLLKKLWPVMAQNHETLLGDIPAKDLKIFVSTLLAMMRNLGETPV